MSHADAKRDFALDVVRQLRVAGYQALWAGGCVRDLLMGRTPQDFDVATDARPEAVRKLFGHRRTLAVGASFGVVIVIGSPQAGNVEVATFRSEGPYLDGRRPEHVVFSTPEEDALRRDFTINGMFFDPVAETVLDYVGGQRDLASRLVRAIGNPADRMREDKLRMLRAIRFTATMVFELDPATADAIRQMAPEIHVVSAERIAQELRKMLENAHRKRAIELAQHVGLLIEILPELAAQLPARADEAGPAWKRMLRRIDLIPSQHFPLAMAALLRDADAQVNAVCQRLRLSNPDSESIRWLLSSLPAVTHAPELPLAKIKPLLADPRAADLLALARSDAIAGDADLAGVAFCEEFLHRTPRELLAPPPLLTGSDLIELGMRPGQRFGELLDAVREAQLNETLAGRADALAFVQRLQATLPRTK